MNQPPALSRIPVMIGGGGEKKTLRMVAQYADESNLTCSLDEVPRKLDALAAHCQRLGRDRSEIVVSKQVMCCIAPSHDQAWAEVEPLARRLGMDIADPAVREIAAGLIFIGGPDEVAEKLSEVLAGGVDGWTIACPANGQDPERVELLGQTAARLLA
jgi:alkanesulfonate monooxygenase SsuD/methylene tetrahydromethanopterin reductase-like flavin-dependent oxidoreductase (luciferase family)